MRLHEERRVSVRSAAPALPEGLTARIRPGQVARVVNTGAGGALVETRCRLRPGATVDVHFEAPALVVDIRALVARAYVSHMRADTILFRAALVFNREISWINNRPCVEAE